MRKARARWCRADQIAHRPMAMAAPPPRKRGAGKLLSQILAGSRGCTPIVTPITFAATSNHQKSQQESESSFGIR